MKKIILIIALTFLFSSFEVKSKDNFIKEGRQNNEISVQNGLDLLKEKATDTVDRIKNFGRPRIVKKGAKPNIILKDEKIFFNEKQLVFGQSLESWKKIIGKDARCSVWKGKPLSCKWDEFGISVGSTYDNPGIVNHITIFFQKDVDTFNAASNALEDGKPIILSKDPKKMFSGYFEMDGFGIDNKTKYWEIKNSIEGKRKLGCGFRDCANPRGIYGDDIELYLTMNRGDEYGELYRIELSQ